MSFELSEVDRQLSGMILPGSVAAVDAGNARVRVESDGWVSVWLPWQAQAAGAARHWRVPSVGEQVVLLCPSGDPAQGFALTGFYTTDHGYDSRPDVVAWQMPDGGKIEYDFASGAVLVDGCKTVTVNAADSITVKSASVTIDAPETTITGNVTIGGALSQGGEGGGNASFGGNVSAQGDVTAGGISLQGHTHTEQGDGADVSTPH
ncbi:phage baseplate assembly protein V [Laribacter hongkongensis]|uniref:phage baseplate assembly protein V n=1 Tax=Laribacter hongkongensis TaxID=168471 RepID=UPI001EFCBEAB|nr:phage baseplate assembly protein V [Laribacter hongkongensis]MCG8991816.1 phage baseplate assembly protein V [Laribacter hongkongensis]MCG9000185.1 phage baseplate assembly protein V [Laribacter hongkongensis]MCG9004458.1 phage baseplate assembly protein V [Laribacter hongkongensis]MCG9006576.1 phage baseplate assembly protein V [Laribacter hongkongensis]MCG9015754.1 phage baseplate assembly protein V [Laribacter hongkongensis]